MIEPTQASGSREAIEAATNRLSAACKEWERRVNTARKAHHAAASKRDKGIRSAERAIAKAEVGTRVGSFSGVQLYDDRIILKGTTHPLDEHVSAAVDTAGNLSVTRRHTLTRFALIGPFSLFTPKKTAHDNRELFVLVEGSDWADIIEVDSKKQKDARRFAQQVNLAARTAEEKKVEKAATVARLTEEHDQLVADTDSIDDLQQQIAAEERDNKAVVDATKALEAELKASPVEGGTWRRNAVKQLRRAYELAHITPDAALAAQLAAEPKEPLWREWTSGWRLAVAASVSVLVVLFVIVGIVSGGGGDDDVDPVAAATTEQTEQTPTAAAQPEDQPEAFNAAALVANGTVADWKPLNNSQKVEVVERWILVKDSSQKASNVMASVNQVEVTSAAEPIRDFLGRAAARAKARAAARTKARAAAIRKAAQRRAAARARARGILVEGVGARVISVQLPKDGPVVVEASHRGGSNFVVKLVGQGLDELLVNEIGSYSGTVVAADVLSGRYRMAIEADGPWSVRYRQPEPTNSAQTLLRTFKGTGSQVIPVRSTEDLDPIVNGRNTGDSNFIVYLVAYGGSVTGRELLFNEIGPYSGQTLTSIPEGDFLLAVQAAGSWSIRFQR